jgi:hypothetical protein
MLRNSNAKMNNSRVCKLSFAKVYPLYVNKAERKGRTKKEVDEIIFWLTGYDDKAIKNQLIDNVSFETFFKNAPQFNPDAVKITGLICGCRIEEIEDELMKKVRYLDKMVDELARGKPLEKILRN